MHDLVTKPNLKRTLTPEELVLSIRLGLEARDPRFQKLPPQPATVGVERAADFRPLAGLTNLHEVTARAKPGLTKVPVQFLRKLLRALLRPWTEHQARYNQATTQLLIQQSDALYEQLTAVHRRIEAEAEANRKSAEALRKGLEEVRFLYFDLNRRMEKLDAQTAAAAGH